MSPKHTLKTPGWVETEGLREGEVGRDHETGKIYIDSWWPVSIHSGEIQLEGTNYTSFKIEQLSSDRLDRRWERWGEVETSGQSPKTISWDTGWGWTQKLEYYKHSIDNSTEGPSHKMQHRKFTKSSKTHSKQGRRLSTQMVKEMCIRRQYCLAPTSQAKVQTGF